MHIMKNLLWIAISAVFLVSFQVMAVERDTASMVLVEKIVQAYGGAGVIERISGVNVEGDIKAVMRAEVGTYKRWFARPRLLRVETVYRNSAEIRILNGDQGWRGGTGNPLREVSGPSHLAMVYQYKQLDLPYGLLKGRFNLRHVGTENIGGRATEAMDVWDDEGPAMRVNVDAAEYFLIKVTGKFSFGGKSTDLVAEFSDFRPVDGMPMPFKINNSAGGMPMSETTIRHYSVNPPADPSLFEPKIKGHGLAFSVAGGGSLASASPIAR